MIKMRILFVDDEASVLDGLRRMLRKQSAHWEMDFALTGQEALEKMASYPFDVIVTDMQMPGMNGAELLERVIKEHPEVARIILSGHADENLAVRAMRVAHQYLAKPTDPETLKLAVAKSCPLQCIVQNERVRSAVASCEGLPVMPALCSELTRLVESPHTETRQIAGVVARDPGMCAKLLQLVNSSFFGVGRRVSSVHHAVSLLGLLRIRALVLREQLFQALPLPRPVRYFSVDRLWPRSLMVAELARQVSLAEGQDKDRPDQAFTAGLLHDIGLLVLASRHADFERALLTVHRRQVPVCQAEMEVMGVTHAEIGAYLLNLWGLPARIVEAVAFHHTPALAPYDGMCAITAVHAADAILGEIEQESESGLAPGLLAPALDMDYLNRLEVAHRLEKWRKLAREASVREPEPVT